MTSLARHLAFLVSWREQFPFYALGQPKTFARCEILNDSNATTRRPDNGEGIELKNFFSLRVLRGIHFSFGWGSAALCLLVEYSATANSKEPFSHLTQSIPRDFIRFKR